MTKRRSACLDTNVLISALLAPNSQSAPSQVVLRSFDLQFYLVLSETTLRELRNKVHHKPNLARRISPSQVSTFIGTLRDIAVVVPEATDEYEPITRDPKDDYLLAPAIRAHVDYVVSGDKDLQVLGEVEGVKILSPADFLALLDGQTIGPSTESP